MVTARVGDKRHHDGYTDEGLSRTGLKHRRHDDDMLDGEAWCLGGGHHESLADMSNDEPAGSDAYAADPETPPTVAGKPSDQKGVDEVMDADAVPNGPDRATAAPGAAATAARAAAEGAIDDEGTAAAAAAAAVSATPATAPNPAGGSGDAAAQGPLAVADGGHGRGLLGQAARPRAARAMGPPGTQGRSGGSQPQVAGGITTEGAVNDDAAAAGGSGVVKRRRMVKAPGAEPRPDGDAAGGEGGRLLREVGGTEFTSRVKRRQLVAEQQAEVKRRRNAESAAADAAWRSGEGAIESHAYVTLQPREEELPFPEGPGHALLVHGGYTGCARCGMVVGWRSQGRLAAPCRGSCPPGSRRPVRRLARGLLPHDYGGAHRPPPWPNGEVQPRPYRPHGAPW